MSEKKIMSEREMELALKRMASEIVERHGGGENLLIVGIQRRGVDLAQQLAKYVKAECGEKVLRGELDISLYRDDLSTLAEDPIIHGTTIPCDLQGKTVVMVDDVLFTGRTARAGLDALYDFGRPAKVWLAILIDRGHRELPIQPDFLGKKVPTARDEQITVKTQSWDNDNSVWLQSDKSNG